MAAINRRIWEKRIENWIYIADKQAGKNKPFKDSKTATSADWLFGLTEESDRFSRLAQRCRQSDNIWNKNVDKYVHMECGYDDRYPVRDLITLCKEAFQCEMDSGCSCFFYPSHVRLRNHQSNRGASCNPSRDQRTDHERFLSVP